MKKVWILLRFDDGYANVNELINFTFNKINKKMNSYIFKDKNCERIVESLKRVFKICIKEIEGINNPLRSQWFLRDHLELV